MKKILANEYFFQYYEAKIISDILQSVKDTNLGVNACIAIYRICLIYFEVRHINYQK